VLHPERDVVAPVAWGRLLADRIPDAEFVALDSDVDLICVSDVIPDMAGEIAAFVGRVLPETVAASPEPSLVTVVAVHAAPRPDIPQQLITQAAQERAAWANVDALIAAQQADATCRAGRPC